MRPPPSLSRRVFLGTSAAAVGMLARPYAATLAAAPSQKLVMLAGKPSHPPLQHEFNAGVLLLEKCLAKFPTVTGVTLQDSADEGN